MQSAQLYLNLLLIFAEYFGALAGVALLGYLVFLWQECATPFRTGRRRAPVRQKAAISGHAKVRVFTIDRRAAGLGSASSPDPLRLG